MHHLTNTNEKQEPRKPNAFSVINAVRDMCQQPDGKKVFLFTLATYCNGDGICYPSNRTLAATTRKSDRTIRRMLSQLAAAGEIEILTPGIGRDQKRIIRLSRYAKPDKAVTGKPDKATAGLNRTRLLGKVPRNSQGEQPLNSQKGSHDMVIAQKSSATTSSFVPKRPYPKTEAEMYATLGDLDIEIDDNYECGNFFAQMEANDWTINGQPVLDWPKAYRARLAKIIADRDGS